MEQPDEAGVTSGQGEWAVGSRQQSQGGPAAGDGHKSLREALRARGGAAVTPSNTSGTSDNDEARMRRRAGQGPFVVKDWLRSFASGSDVSGSEGPSDRSERPIAMPRADAARNAALGARQAIGNGFRAVFQPVGRKPSGAAEGSRGAADGSRVAKRKDAVATSKARPRPAGSEDVEDDGPGEYLVSKPLKVTDSEALGGNDIHIFNPGDRIDILEVRLLPDGSRLRARVSEPSGWISLANRAKGYRWADKVRPSPPAPSTSNGLEEDAINDAPDDAIAAITPPLLNTTEEQENETLLNPQEEKAAEEEDEAEVAAAEGEPVMFESERTGENDLVEEHTEMSEPSPPASWIMPSIEEMPEQESEVASTQTSPMKSARRVSNVSNVSHIAEGDEEANDDLEEEEAADLIDRVLEQAADTAEEATEASAQVDVPPEEQSAEDAAKQAEGPGQTFCEAVSPPAEQALASADEAVSPPAEQASAAADEANDEVPSEAVDIPAEQAPEPAEANEPSGELSVELSEELADVHPARVGEPAEEATLRSEGSTEAVSPNGSRNGQQALAETQGSGDQQPFHRSDNAGADLGSAEAARPGRLSVGGRRLKGVDDTGWIKASSSTATPAPPQGPRPSRRSMGAKAQASSPHVSAALKDAPDERGGGISKELPGRLNDSIRDIWSKNSVGYMGAPLAGEKHLSMGEAQAKLQRLVAAGKDFDEVRRLRKLLDVQDVDPDPAG